VSQAQNLPTLGWKLFRVQAIPTFERFFHRSHRAMIRLLDCYIVSQSTESKVGGSDENPEGVFSPQEESKVRILKRFLTDQLLSSKNPFGK
jgi:hypothetical protein